MAADSSGNVFVAATSATGQTCLFKLDPQGNLLAQTCIDGLPAALIAVGPDGNPVVAGTASAPGSVTLVSPLNSQTGSGYVVKFKADLSGIVFSTLFGGSANTTLSALTISRTGDIYIGGSTDGQNFPGSSGAFQGTAPSGVYPAWVAAISSAGDRILWATLLGGAQSCSNCSAGTAGVSSIAVDSSGDAVVAGAATNEQIPVTSGVLGTTCGCTTGASATFLAKIGSGGTQLQWASWFNNANVDALALDNAGNIYLGGNAGPSFSATSGSLQSSYPAAAYIQSDTLNYAQKAGFAAEISPDATQLRFATWLGGNNFSRTMVSYGVFSGINGVTGLAVDTIGTIWVTGGSLPSELPVPNSTPVLGADYVIGLSADGSSVKSATTVPEGGAGLAIAVTSQGPVALGKTGSVLMPVSSAVTLSGVVNSAGLNVGGSVAPNELVSFYGSGLGPSTPVSAVAVNGALTTSLGGVEVEFDGVAAPLLYVGPNQINAVVPSSVGGQSSTTVQITTPNGTLTGLVLAAAPAIPDVFAAPAPGNAAFALNQDGTLNSITNPAAPGSVVSVWATGGGASGNPEADGAITGSSFYPLTLPLTVGTGSMPGVQQNFPGTTPIPPPDVLYSGDAPDLVKGTMQINFRIPQPGEPQSAPVEAAAFYLQVGNAYSDPFTVYVKYPSQ